jgi:creatinine amidohydrolase
MPSRDWLELTQPEIAAQLQRNPLVILPAGSVEQHGPHLPASTDILAARVIALAVAERMDALVLPGGPLGVTPIHMPYEATISLRPETYSQLVIDTCVSVASHGAMRLLILNWHEGNIPSLALAAETLHRTHGLAVVTVQACYVASEMYGQLYGGLTHGGEIETLAVLATRPDLVYLGRVADASSVERGQAIDKLRRTREYQPVLTDIRSIAPTGWYGDPRAATPQRANEMVRSIAEAIAREANEIFTQLAAVQGARPPARATDG